MDSLEQDSNSILALEGATQEASREACASLEDGSIVGGPLGANNVVGEAPSEEIVGSSFLARLAMVNPCRPRGPNRLVLKAPVKPTTWD